MNTHKNNHAVAFHEGLKFTRRHGFNPFNLKPPVGQISLYVEAKFIQECGCALIISKLENT